MNQLPFYCIFHKHKAQHTLQFFLNIEFPHVYCHILRAK